MKKQPILKLCEICGFEFEQLYYDKKFCSNKCSGLFRKEQCKINDKNFKNCLICSKVFKPKNQVNKYCSLVCAGIGNRNKNFKCENCQVEFRKLNMSSKTKFCCRKCYLEFVNRDDKIKIPDDKNKLKVKKICKKCLKEYYIHKYRKNTNSFCSKKCFTDYGRTYQTCKFCKKLFIKQKHILFKVYCSLECSLNRVNSISKNEKQLRETLKLFFEVKNNKQVKILNDVFNVDIIFENKIIEYYGDYFHCNPKVYNETYFNKKLNLFAKDKWKKDLDRKELLEKNNYKVLIIWEKDYNEDKNKEIEKCKSFLSQK